MVGIRVYVHNAIPLYPDHTPFTRRVLGSIGTENLVKVQQHTALPQQRCLSRPCAPVCSRTAGRAGGRGGTPAPEVQRGRRGGVQRPFALPIPSTEARRLPNILAVGCMIQPLRKAARACVSCSSLACWPPRWGTRVHMHSLREGRRRRDAHSFLRSGCGESRTRCRGDFPPRRLELCVLSAAPVRQ